MPRDSPPSCAWPAISASGPAVNWPTKCGSTVRHTVRHRERLKPNSTLRTLSQPKHLFFSRGNRNHDERDHVHIPYFNIPYMAFIDRIRHPGMVLGREVRHLRPLGPLLPCPDSGKSGMASTCTIPNTRSTLNMFQAFRLAAEFGYKEFHSHVHSREIRSR